jgi:hypothetical protein
MRTKQLLLLSIFLLSTFISNAQISYSKLAETTVTENPDGTATLTATIVGDLSEYSGENYVKVNGGRFSTEMISVVTEVTTTSGVSVMVIKVNYSMDKLNESDLNPSRVEVYHGLKNVPGVLIKANPIYSDAAVEQVNALFEEMDIDFLGGGED